MTKLGNSTIFEMIHDYLKIYLPKQRKVSPDTIHSYQKALELLVDFVKDKKKIPLQDVTFEMLTAEMIIFYLDYIETERGCSITTRNNRLSSIRAFLVYAANRDVTTVVALNELTKVPLKPITVKAVEYMSLAAITAIVEQADILTPNGLRDCVFILLMYDTGARIQEMIDIKLCDLNLGKTPTVTLNGKGNKVRSVPLMEKTAIHLQKYLSEFHKGFLYNVSAPLFYSVIHNKQNPLTARRIRYILKEYGERAREVCPEVPKRIYPHLFRHSRAMHLYQNGMDLILISQWLGHSQLETTQIYAHADTEQKRKAIAAATPKNDPLHKRLSPDRFTVTDEDTLKRLSGLR